MQSRSRCLTQSSTPKQAPPIPAESLPAHVGIIMDGNGRWAKKRFLPRAMGHRAGVEALRDIIRAASDWGIRALSLYAFSTENWARPMQEVDALMKLLVEFFHREIDELHAERVRIRILGRTDALPEAPRRAVEDAQRRTAGNTGLNLCIALNYGGRDELVRACRRLAAEVQSGARAAESIDENALRDALDTAGLPDVDLVIRTSGEMRLSNFLPFQAAYAEFIAVDAYWPDFTRDAFAETLRAYARRDRRFGGLGSAKSPS